MNTTLSMTESMIRQRADTKVFTRGRAYYDGGYVNNVVWRGGELWAEVEGSEYEPYRVHVIFDGPNILTANCTCPYDWGGDCKHIVAVLLHLAHHHDEIEERPSVRDLIQKQDRDRLADLLLHLLDRNAGLVDEMEQFLTVEPIDAAASASSSALPAVDVDLLRRQILADLRGSLQTGYDSWGEERWYDSDLGAALGPAQTRIRAMLDADDAGSALALLEAVTQAWDDGVDELDEYAIEYFMDVGGDFTQELGELWAEAILAADLSPDESTGWADGLQEWAETILGGESLEMAVRAAIDGWDYPPLVSAMQGNITEAGAWDGEAPWYADSLAQVRLRVLERRGQYQEYLNLAQAEGEFLLYLHMLVKTGQPDLAVDEAKEFLDRPSDYHALAQTLLDCGETERAFDLAQHGLSVRTASDKAQQDWPMTSHSHGKAGLAVWLRDAAWTQGRPELALDTAQLAFVEETTLPNYSAVEKMAGEHWPTIKPKMLQLVAEHGGTDGKVDIYLHEEMYAEAIEAVDNSQWFFDVDKVIEAVKVDYPDWAFAQCRRQAEEIMDAGRSSAYDVAVEWLRRGRDILLAAGKREKWTAYLNDVMEVHQRKYKLMPMLRTLKV